MFRRHLPFWLLLYLIYRSLDGRQTPSGRPSHSIAPTLRVLRRFFCWCWNLCLSVELLSDINSAQATLYRVVQKHLEDFRVNSNWRSIRG